MLKNLSIGENKKLFENRLLNITICIISLILTVIVTIVMVYTNLFYEEKVGINNTTNYYESEFIEDTIEHISSIETVEPSIEDTQQETLEPIEEEPETIELETSEDMEPVIFFMSAPTPGTPKIELYLADQLNVSYSIQNVNYNVTEQDIRYIASVIQTEVLGPTSDYNDFNDQSLKYFEMLAVAQTIRNRVECKIHFPNSIQGVIFAHHITDSGKKIYQFSAANVLDKYIPVEGALTAAKEVFINGLTVLPLNYYYFCASSIESRFESMNDYCFIKNENGIYDKIKGDTTTFYAGK